MKGSNATCTPAMWMSGTLIIISATIALCGMLGPISAWLDVANAFDPIALGLGLLASSLAILAFRIHLAPSYIVGASLIAILGPAALMAPDFVARAQDVMTRNDQPSNPVRVLSLNAWNEDVSPMLAFNSIIAVKPDILLVQESNGLDTVRGRLCGTLRFRIVKCDQRPLWGLDIYSRWRIHGSGIVFPSPSNSLHTAIIWAEIQVPHQQPLIVITSHLKWPIPPDGQAVQRRELAAFAATFGGRDVIVAADMNSVSWSYGLSELDRSLRPLTRRSHALFTWPSYLQGLGRSSPFALLPIDQLYASPALRTLTVRSVDITGSDHRAILAVLSR